MIDPLTGIFAAGFVLLISGSFFIARRADAEIRRLRDENRTLTEKVEDIPRLVSRARIDSVATSRRVLKGQISEEIFPLLPGFPFQPSDCKFMGAPVDYIVFEGMSEERITGITILEVKTGSARLNERQRQIQNCVKAGRVEFREVRLDLPPRNPTSESALADSSPEPQQNP